jgi:hypothetical protein
MLPETGLFTEVSRRWAFSEIQIHRRAYPLLGPDPIASPRPHMMNRSHASSGYVHDLAALWMLGSVGSATGVLLLELLRRRSY